MASYDVETRRRILGYDDLGVAAAAALGALGGHVTKLLSVGCGTGQELVVFGNASKRAAGAAAPIKLVGVDPSQQMVELARKRLAAELPTDVAATAEVLHGTLADADPNAARFARYFDGATSVLVMQFLPDLNDATAPNSKRAYLAAIAQRLQPGATLFLMDACGDKTSAAGDATLDAHLHLWTDYIHLKGGDTQTVAQTQAIMKGALHVVSEARVTQLLHDAGFVDVLRVYSAFHFVGFRARYAPTAGGAAAGAAAASGAAATTTAAAGAGGK